MKWLTISQTRRTTWTMWLVTLALTGAGLLLLVAVGGTTNLNPNYMLVPIAIVAFYFGPLPGALAGVAIGLAVGPMMVEITSDPQPLADWVIRLAVHVAAAVVIGAMSLYQKTTMLRVVQAQQRMLEHTPDIIERERLKALREMASGVVHDFNNSLSPIMGFSDLLMVPGALDNRETANRYIAAINKAGADAAAVVHRLRQFYQADQAGHHLAPVSLAHVVDQTLAMTEARWGAQARLNNADIKVHVDCPEDLVVIGNEADLRGLLTNVIFNAVDVMPNGGSLSFKCASGDGSVVLEVADTGVGMSAATLARCKDAYFTTKESGTGLGISIAAAILRYHGGRLDIASTQGQGATVRLSFPAPTTEKLNSAVNADPLPETPPLRILVVEDEPMVRDMLAEVLSSSGHQVTLTNDGTEGLRTFQHGPDRFDLVFSDGAMPRMSGRHMVTEIRKLKPEMPFVLLSGFEYAPPPEDDGTSAPSVYVRKPATVVEIRRAIWEVTSRPTG